MEGNGSSSSNRAKTIRFGPFDLDVRSGELCKGGARIRLPDQPLQVLLMLLERPGEVVLREEIRNNLWPGSTVVEFDHSINAAVRRLRDALRESADKPRYVETIPRRGYRFIGQVEAPAAESPAVIAGANTESDRSSAPPVQEPDPPILAPAGEVPSRPFGTTWFGVPVLLGIILLFLISGWWYFRIHVPARWAREVALPEATRLVDAGNAPDAFPILHKALRILPTDPALNRILREISHPLGIRTTPPGADIEVKPYGRPETAWVFIGRSPMDNFLLPLGYFRWRIAKPGYRTVEAAGGFQSDIVEFILDREGSIPADMVHVPGGNFQLLGLNPVHLDDFWMDRYEVTNRQYKEFIDAGAYTNRKYWRQEFVRDGHAMTWEQAMAEFRDPTGRQGPSTWELGDYPADRADFPVSGISWYEAAAYAEFAGKQLPTVFHWYRAAGQRGGLGLGIYSDVLFFSNFDGTGPVRVGSRLGLGPYGTYDMAGNVREWCWNSGADRRYILGGSWNDSRYAYANPAAASPFDRSAANGFRCVRYPEGPVSTALTERIDKPARDYRTEKPASDQVFRVLQSFYTYDHTELKAARESTDEGSPVWKAEKITFDAAYDHQRVTAWLYLPRTVSPPYQTVVYVPPRSAIYLSKADEFEIKFIEFLVKTGRAVLFPICQGMYQRRVTDPLEPGRARDRVVQQCKDLRRSLDYLDTRTDIVHDRMGFYGISDGASLGLILLALEPRIRAAVLAAGGFSPERKPPEIDEINFAPRIRIPVLMLNGRYDLSFPAEANQVPLLHLLGTPEDQKRYVLFDFGHVPVQSREIKDTLDWFDRYLGPPQQIGRAGRAPARIR